jgi:hypothetical protein
MKVFANRKSIFSLAAILVLSISVLSTPGIAWSGLRDDVREFHLFLRDHPRVSSDLRSNPNLVNSRRYLDQHEALARFIRRRPALRDEIRSNPNRVFGRYYAYDRYDRYDRFGRWR